MALFEAFQGIAIETVAIRNLARCMEHAEPVLAVLETLKNIPPPQGIDARFSYEVNPYPEYNRFGSMFIGAGLRDSEGKMLTLSGRPADPSFQRIEKTRAFSLTVEADGSMRICREDVRQIAATPRPQTGLSSVFKALGALVDGRPDPEKAVPGNVNEVLAGRGLNPILKVIADWTEINMPHTESTLARSHTPGRTQGAVTLR
jgi:hypothetical protein